MKCQNSQKKKNDKTPQSSFQTISEAFSWSEAFAY